MTARHPSEGRGQALPEFALVFPLFAIVVFGIIQFGLIFGGDDALNNSVREATRYASTVPVANTSDAGTCATGVGAQVYSRLQTVLAQKFPAYQSSNLVACGQPSPSTTVTYCIRPNPVPTNSVVTYSIWVQVTAVYRFPLYIPLVGAIVDRFDGSADNALRASASEQMRVETYSLSGLYLGAFPTCS